MGGHRRRSKRHKISLWDDEEEEEEGRTMVLFCVLEGGKECGLKRHMADTVKMLLNQEKIDWLIGRVGQRREWKDEL